MEKKIQNAEIENQNLSHFENFDTPKWQKTN